MAGIVQRTVFISYRRIAPFHARAVYQHLSANGYDVFMDVERMDSGAFDEILLRQIAARAHFVLLLTPGALDRCANPDDWLRREIEHAIDMKRNIVPVTFDGFDWKASAPYMTGKLSVLGSYNGLNVPADFFEEAMGRLRTRYLNIDVDAVIHPAPAEDKPIVEERKAEAEAVPAVMASDLAAEQYAEAARANIANGQYDEAFAAATRAIELNPRNASSYNCRGFVFCQRGEYDYAIADFKKAIRLEPAFGIAYNNLGYAHYKNGDYDPAIVSYTESIRLDPDDASTYRNRAFAYFEKGDYSKALVDETRAVEGDPIPFHYRNRAATYRKLGRIAEAEADEREAERLEREGK